MMNNERGNKTPTSPLKMKPGRPKKKTSLAGNPGE